MTNIIRAAEEQFPYQRYRNKLQDLDISQSVAAAACSLADNLNAAAIVATTRSGATARHVARFRPRGLIIALSPSEKTVRRLAMCWGCIPCYLQLTDDTDEIIEKAAESALKTGHVKAGDVVVITGGRPLYAAGTTNMLWVKWL
jgi:pyruvate kinase